MRVSIGIHGEDVEKAIETYELMSTKHFTHATPTLFNAGTPKPQMSSCFLLSMKEDSIEGIFDTLKQCATISKHAGGIGVAVSCIRSSQSSAILYYTVKELWCAGRLAKGKIHALPESYSVSLQLDINIK